MEFRMFYWDTVVTNRARARSVLREGDAARLRRLAPEWDRRTTRMSETSRILILTLWSRSYRRLVLVAAEGPTGDPTLLWRADILGGGGQRDLVVGVTVNPVHRQIRQIRCPESVFAVARTPHRRIAGGAGDSSDANMPYSIGFR